jgi:sugar lactone lactonase YvrE
MNKIFATFRIAILTSILLAACAPATTPTDTPASPTDAETPVPPTDTETPVPPTETLLPPTPTLTPTPAGPTVTQVTIDGDPADWAGYDVALTDPEGDHSGGGFDIAAVRAFANDQFLYVLIETHEPRGEYVQLDLNIDAGGRSFVVTFKPEEGGPAVMGEMTPGGFVQIGDVPGSASAAGETVEFKMPLSAFEDTTGLALVNVRPMAGECCGEHWEAIDEIDPVQVAQVDEVEPASKVAGPPQVCAAEIAPPVPLGTFEPAPVQIAQPGYTTEWFIAPSTFNMPRDVLLTPQGGLLVLGTRNFALFRVTQDGTVTRLAEVNGMEGDVDVQGNVYVHSASDGTITRITPDGVSSILVRSPDLETSCDSGFGFGPDGNFYLARNLCDFGEMDRADLYQITTSGQIVRAAEQIPALVALRTASDGRFLGGAQGQEIYELSLDDYSLTQLGSVPGREGIAAGGLATDAAGNIYVSTGTRSPSGEIYRLDANGEVSLLAEISGNGLSGIEWQSTGEIVGVQLQLGTLISVTADGSLQEIVPGNGIITPRGMAFSPCGELAVSNENGGLMVLVNPAGAVSRFFEYNSFTSPVSFVVFDPQGTLYATEGAPGLPDRVISVSPGEAWPVPLIDAGRPSGIVRRADGTLIVAETITGCITQLNPDGSTATFADGLTRPTALALDADDNLYAVTGTGGRPLDEYHMPESGDTLLRFTPEGDATILTHWSKLAGLTFAPSGDFYAATGWDGGIVRISPDGTVTPFASGLEEVTDLAFDLAGNLYASDTVLNGIVRIGGFPQGTLSGTVTDESGAPVEGARVQVLSDWPIVAGQVMTTDADGRFSLSAAPRTYAIIVTTEGYETTTLEGIQVTVDQETEIEIELEG